MPLALDARQRAMLAEMGIRLWPQRARAATAPTPAAPAPTPPASPAPPAPVPAAARARPQPAATEAPSAAAGKLALAPLPEGIDRMDWPQLEAAVAACRACGLCAGRTQAVFGTGCRTAEWMVVGEAPGEAEDRLGQPFVGPAGQLLDNMLAAIGLSRLAESAGAQGTAGAGPRGAYIANVIQCRPPGNRNPEPDEVATCAPWLHRQIALVQPKIILAMGRFAAQSLVASTEPIGRLRGRVHHYQGVPVVVTYHPAYLLRAPAEKAKAWEDLCLALATHRQAASSAAS